MKSFRRTSEAITIATLLERGLPSHSWTTVCLCTAACIAKVTSPTAETATSQIITSIGMSIAI
jgi:hypothetical protein